MRRTEAEVIRLRAEDRQGIAWRLPVVLALLAGLCVCLWWDYWPEPVELDKTDSTLADIDADPIFDLGSSRQQRRDIYISGTVYCDRVIQKSVTSNSITTVTVDENYERVKDENYERVKDENYERVK